MYTICIKQQRRIIVMSTHPTIEGARVALQSAPEAAYIQYPAQQQTSAVQVLAKRLYQHYAAVDAYDGANVLIASLRYYGVVDHFSARIRDVTRSGECDSPGIVY